MTPEQTTATSTQKTLISLEERIQQMHGNVQEVAKMSQRCRKVSAVIGAEAAAADTFLAHIIIKWESYVIHCSDDVCMPAVFF